MKWIDRRSKREKRELARQLRRMSTPEESRLWKELRTNKLGGFHFRRQHVLAGFIVDFYCAQAQVVIELDGEHHLQQLEADQQRDAVLRGLGNMVLRFPNELIRTDLPSVLSVIRTTIVDRTQPGVPLPRSGEGVRG